LSLTHTVLYAVGYGAGLCGLEVVGEEGPAVPHHHGDGEEAAVGARVGEGPAHAGLALYLLTHKKSLVHKKFNQENSCMNQPILPSFYAVSHKITSQMIKTQAK